MILLKLSCAFKNENHLEEIYLIFSTLWLFLFLTPIKIEMSISKFTITLSGNDNIQFTNINSFAPDSYLVR